MEQKRTLWIVAAVGVFLLVVLGAALILYTPQSKPATIANSRGMNNGTASNGWISLAPSAPVQNSNPNEQIEEENTDFTQEENPTSTKAEFRTDEVNIYTEKTNVYSEKTDLNKLGENATVSSEKVSNSSANEKNAATTIDLTEPTKSSTKNVAQNTKNPASNVVEKTPAKEKPIQPKTVVKVEQKNTAKTVKPETKTASAKPAAKEPEIIQYWVQVTALTSRKAADEARNKLDENQITADVFTYTDNKKQLFYRVRVGPYTTKSEAEYWRTKISKIDTFQNTSSYITSTTVSK